MVHRDTAFCLAVGFILVGPAYGTAQNQSQEIAPGVTFTQYDAPGPNIVHVVAADRLRPEYKLKIGWPQKRRNFTARARTSAIAGLYHDPPDHPVLAAVNASFYSAQTPGITGTAASGGQILEAPSGGHDTFLFGPTRQPIIRSRISHQSGTLTFAGGTTTPLGFYNRRDPPVNAITAYTPDWAPTTGTDFSSAPDDWVEVTLTGVTYPMRGHKQVSGIVSSIRTTGTPGNSTILAGGMVLSAWGTSRATILNNTQVGHRLRMRFVTGTTDFNNTDMAITGIGWLVHNGQPNTANWSRYSESFVNSRHPRTVLAWNDAHLFLMVCDGRSTESVGMSFSELADFLIGTLDAAGAVNLDGGGSSTMVVHGVVRNTPSDAGGERSVANAVMLAREDTSTTFPFADTFTSTGRLPGWDDKFTFNEIIPFSPAAPGGNDHVIRVADPAGGVETARRGDFGDADYSIEAKLYCEYRPDVAADGFDRYGIFARDSGTGAFGLSTFGGGNCYAMVYDSHDGRVRAGKYVNGTLTDFLEQPLYLPQTAWRRFGIDCYGPVVSYRLDGQVIAQVNDTTHRRGQYGIGYHEFFANNANIRGARADRFRAFVVPPLPDMDGDGDVDQDDFGLFQACFSGPYVPWPPGCQKADIDRDGDVDHDDFLIFHRCFSGPNIPADPYCTH